MFCGAILAAGLGTRLRPLTALRPKPLVPVAGVPLLELGLDALARAGVTRIGVNAFHLGDQLPTALAHRDERITIVDEAALQGTGGGLRGIAHVLPPGPLVALNGDALFAFELAPLLAEHRASGAIATLVLRHVPPGSPFARVGVAPDGSVHRISEVEGPEPHRPDLVFGAFTGVQVLEPALLAAIPAAGACDILRSAYRVRLAERAVIRGVFVPGEPFWLDVGTIDRYLEANRAALEGRLPAPRTLPAADAGGRRVDSTALIGRGARLDGPCAVLAGAEIGPRARVGPGSIVDRGARLAAGAVVDGCVVWPGVFVEGAHRDTVLM